MGPGSASASSVVTLVNAGTLSINEARKTFGFEPVDAPAVSLNNSNGMKYGDYIWFGDPIPVDGEFTNPNITVSPNVTFYPNPAVVPGAAQQNIPIIYTQPPVPYPTPSSEELEAMLEAAGLHDVLAKHRKMRAQPDEKEPVEIEVLPLDRKRRIRLA